MTSEERIKRQKELVEAMARRYDKETFQPIAARILGLLLIMDKERYTFDEIVEELQISKSSASNAIRILEIRDFIEYITKAGDRKRYFQIKKFDRFSIINEHSVKLKQTSDFLQAVLELKANKESENAMCLRNLVDIINYFLEKFEELKKDYLDRQ
jgi:DNA-binding transcriptional regulator GbsR (MarR family)